MMIVLIFGVLIVVGMMVVDSDGDGILLLGWLRCF